MGIFDYEIRHLAYPIPQPCPECGGQLKRWRCRAYCMDCRAIIHFMTPLEPSGVKYKHPPIEGGRVG